MDMLQHGHHYNENGCPISIVDSAEGRAQDIVNNKPKHEIERRLSLLRVITPDMLPKKARKAREAYYKAEEALNKAEEALNKAWDAYDKALEDYDKAGDAPSKARGTYNKAWEAYDKTRDAFLASLTPAEWEAWHKTVCLQPDCLWTAKHPSIFEED